MKKSELLELLEREGISPSKKLGQNFMIDPNQVDFIVRQAEVAPSDTVVEIGPGTGTLTERLIGSGATVIAIEFDRKLAARLRETLKAPNFTPIEADALDADYAALTGGKPFRVVANLPYSISSPLIATLIELEIPPVDMLLLLQKETAERFAAPPGCPAYGALSVRVQTVYEARYIRTIPPNVFYPRPEVASGLVRFSIRKTLEPVATRHFLGEVVRAAFSRRRKKCLNNLAAVFKDTDLKAVFAAAGISPDARAEELSPETFSRLAEAIAAVRAPA